ncbi:hypothetical protein D3C85_1562260 [compost metagenome]
MTAVTALDMGSTIWVRVRHSLAPSILALSRIPRSMPMKKPRRMMMLNTEMLLGRISAQ